VDNGRSGDRRSGYGPFGGNGGCEHSEVVPVRDVFDELVAQLCIGCDAQLPADWRAEAAPPVARRRTNRWVIAALVVGLAGVVLAGMVVAVVRAVEPGDARPAQAHPHRDQAPAQPAEIGDVVADAGTTSGLSVGDCVLEMGSGSDPFRTVPCAQPHAAEVYAVFELPDGPFPGEDAVFDTVHRECLARFTDYVGVSYDASRLGMTSIDPADKASWYQDYREAVCMIIGEGGSLTGSVKGSRR
jgi:hypothetical protein